MCFLTSHLTHILYDPWNLSIVKDLKKKVFFLKKQMKTSRAWVLVAVHRGVKHKVRETKSARQRLQRLWTALKDQKDQTQILDF